MQQQFGIYEVAKASGLTLRQLQWWDEEGFIQPEHVGHRRIYSAENARLVMVAAQLRKRSYSLQKIRPLIGAIQRRLRMVSGDAYFVTDGAGVLIGTAEQAIEFASKSRKPVVMFQV